MKREMNDYPYDKADIQSIYEFARGLEGKKISEIISNERDINKKDKGMVGNAIQEDYFGIPRNSSSEPDFPLAPLELKSFGYWLLKSGGRADQRLSLTDIKYMDFVGEISFEKSHLNRKCHNMLFVIYLLEESKERVNSEIKHIRLYDFDSVVQADIQQIKKDFYTIAKKIQDGKASELSEGDTEFLGAARTGTKTSRQQIAPKGDVAFPRRFAFKQSYMSYLVREYIIPNKGFNESVRKIRGKSAIKIPKGKTFEEWLLEVDKKYVGKTVNRISKYKKIREIKGKIDFDMKNAYSELGYAMLGVRSNEDDYLRKTNTVIKSVRVNQNGITVESSPFPNFRIMDIVEQEWSESDMFNYLSERRFILQIFVQSGRDYIYTGHAILKFTPEELEETVRPTWEDFKSKVILGLKFKLEINKNGTPKIISNVNGKVEGQIGLIKLHAWDIVYDIAIENISGTSSMADEYIRNHTICGRFVRKPENKQKYGDCLPNGDIITKQSFWLNKSYILEYLQENAPELLNV